MQRARALAALLVGCGAGTIEGRSEPAPGGGPNPSAPAFHPKLTSGSPMNTPLFLIGIAKLCFGVLIAAFGVFFGLRVVHRLLEQEGADRALADGNIALGVMQASCLVSLGLLVQPAVQASFDAMDLLYRGQRLAPAMLARFAMYGLLHVGTALFVGAIVVTLGIKLFVRLTSGVDELAEIRKGNVAPALALGAVIVVMSLLAAPGVRSILDGLLPLPELPRDVVPMPT